MMSHAMPGKPIGCSIEHAGCAADRLGVVVEARALYKRVLAIGSQSAVAVCAEPQALLGCDGLSCERAGDVVHLPGRDLHAIAVVGPVLPQLRRISHIRSADSVMHHGKREARADAGSVYQHCAGATLAMVAAFLGSCQREMLT
jgi:hypothetical protein